MASEISKLYAELYDEPLMHEVAEVVEDIYRHRESIWKNLDSGIVNFAVMLDLDNPEPKNIDDYDLGEGVNIRVVRNGSTKHQSRSAHVTWLDTDLGNPSRRKALETHMNLTNKIALNGVPEMTRLYRSSDISFLTEKLRVILRLTDDLTLNEGATAWTRDISTSIHTWHPRRLKTEYLPAVSGAKDRKMVFLDGNYVDREWISLTSADNKIVGTANHWKEDYKKANKESGLVGNLRRIG